MYILSDEEIKEGDWCINKYKVLFKQETDKIFPIFNGSKKVIATTNLELHKDKVARIAESFIKKYITEYNKDNIIEWVKIKDSWTREEVIDLLNKFAFEFNAIDRTINEQEKWIEENL